jgi:anaerobic magnesium-protoporphyrin IX monomethyl ester cyclase
LKILFLNPAIREESVPRHVPYGQALMVAMADKRGHHVQVFDANAWRPTDEDLAEAVREDDWDVIATGGITTTYSYIKKAVHIARVNAPRALIVAGGGFLTSMPTDIMNFLPELDLGIVGEGFLTWPEILLSVDTGDKDWTKIKGVIYRDLEGTLRMNPGRELVSDLDGTVPFPAWEFFPLDIYFQNSGILVSEEAMQAKRRLDINASYGCNLICRFCFSPWALGRSKIRREKARAA